MSVRTSLSRNLPRVLLLLPLGFVLLGVVLAPQPSLGHLTAQVRGLPTSILLGPDGRIAKKVEGVFHEEALRAALEELLSSFHHDLVHEEPGIFRGPRMPVWKRSSVPRVNP